MSSSQRPTASSTAKADQKLGEPQPPPPFGGGSPFGLGFGSRSPARPQTTPSASPQTTPTRPQTQTNSRAAAATTPQPTMQRRLSNNQTSTSSTNDTTTVAFAAVHDELLHRFLSDASQALQAKGRISVRTTLAVLPLHVARQHLAEWFELHDKEAENSGSVKLKERGKLGAGKVFAEASVGILLAALVSAEKVPPSVGDDGVLADNTWVARLMELSYDWLLGRGGADPPPMALDRTSLALLESNEHNKLAALAASTLAVLSRAGHANKVIKRAVREVESRTRQEGEGSWFQKLDKTRAETLSLCRGLRELQLVPGQAQKSEMLLMDSHFVNAAALVRAMAPGSSARGVASNRLSPAARVVEMGLCRVLAVLLAQAAKLESFDRSGSSAHSSSVCSRSATKEWHETIRDVKRHMRSWLGIKPRNVIIGYPLLALLTVLETTRAQQSQTGETHKEDSLLIEMGKMLLGGLNSPPSVKVADGGALAARLAAISSMTWIAHAVLARHPAFPLTSSNDIPFNRGDKLFLLHRMADSICRCVRQRQLLGESAVALITTFCAVCAGASCHAQNRREGVAFVVRTVALELLRVGEGNGDAAEDSASNQRWCRVNTDTLAPPSEVQLLGIRCLCAAIHAALHSCDPLYGPDVSTKMQDIAEMNRDVPGSFSDAFLQLVDGGGHTLAMKGAFDASAACEARWLRGACAAAQAASASKRQLDNEDGRTLDDVALLVNVRVDSQGASSEVSSCLTLSASMPALRLSTRGLVRRCVRIVGGDFVAHGWFPAAAYPGSTRPDLLSQSGVSTAYASYSALLPQQFAAPPMNMDATSQPHIADSAARFLRYFLRSQPFLPSESLPGAMSNVRGLLSTVVCLALCSQYAVSKDGSASSLEQADRSPVDQLAAEAVACMDRVVAQNPSANCALVEVCSKLVLRVVAYETQHDAGVTSLADKEVPLDRVLKSSIFDGDSDDEYDIAAATQHRGAGTTRSQFSALSGALGVQARFDRLMRACVLPRSPRMRSLVLLHAAAAEWACVLKQERLWQKFATRIGGEGSVVTQEHVVTFELLEAAALSTLCSPHPLERCMGYELLRTAKRLHASFVALLDVGDAYGNSQPPQLPMPLLDVFDELDGDSQRPQWIRALRTASPQEWVTLFACHLLPQTTALRPTVCRLASQRCSRQFCSLRPNSGLQLWRSWSAAAMSLPFPMAYTVHAYSPADQYESGDEAPLLQLPLEHTRDNGIMPLRMMLSIEGETFDANMVRFAACDAFGVTHPTRIGGVIPVLVKALMQLDSCMSFARILLRRAGRMDLLGQHGEVKRSKREAEALASAENTALNNGGPGRATIRCVARLIDPSRAVALPESSDEMETLRDLCFRCLFICLKHLSIPTPGLNEVFVGSDPSVLGTVGRWKPIPLAMLCADTLEAVSCSHLAVSLCALASAMAARGWLTSHDDTGPPWMYALRGWLFRRFDAWVSDAFVSGAPNPLAGASAPVTASYSSVDDGSSESGSEHTSRLDDMRDDVSIAPSSRMRSAKSYDPRRVYNRHRAPTPAGLMSSMVGASVTFYSWPSAEANPMRSAKQVQASIAVPALTAAVSVLLGADLDSEERVSSSRIFVALTRALIYDTAPVGAALWDAAAAARRSIRDMCQRDKTLLAPLLDCCYGCTSSSVESGSAAIAARRFCDAVVDELCRWAPILDQCFAPGAKVAPPATSPRSRKLLLTGGARARMLCLVLLYDSIGASDAHNSSRRRFELTGAIDDPFAPTYPEALTLLADGVFGYGGVQVGDQAAEPADEQEGDESVELASNLGRIDLTAVPSPAESVVEVSQLDARGSPMLDSLDPEVKVSQRLAPKLVPLTVALCVEAFKRLTGEGISEACHRVAIRRLLPWISQVVLKAPTPTRMDAHGQGTRGLFRPSDSPKLGDSPTTTGRAGVQRTARDSPQASADIVVSSDALPTDQNYSASRSLLHSMLRATIKRLPTSAADVARLWKTLALTSAPNARCCASYLLEQSLHDSDGTGSFMLLESAWRRRCMKLHRVGDDIDAPRSHTPLMGNGKTWTLPDVGEIYHDDVSLSDVMSERSSLDRSRAPSERSAFSSRATPRTPHEHLVSPPRRQRTLSMDDAASLFSEDGAYSTGSFTKSRPLSARSANSDGSVSSTAAMGAAATRCLLLVSRACPEESVDQLADTLEAHWIHYNASTDGSRDASASVAAAAEATVSSSPARMHRRSIFPNAKSGALVRAACGCWSVWDSHVFESSAWVLASLETLGVVALEASVSIVWPHLPLLLQAATIYGDMQRMDSLHWSSADAPLAEERSGASRLRVASRRLYFSLLTCAERESADGVAAARAMAATAASRGSGGDALRKVCELALAALEASSASPSMSLSSSIAGSDTSSSASASVDGRQSSAAARASLRERWACETLRWAGHSASSSRRQQSLRVYTALKPRASSHHAGQVLRCAEAALADAESGRDGIHGAMDAMAEVCEALMAAAGIVARLKGSGGAALALYGHVLWSSVAIFHDSVSALALLRSELLVYRHFPKNAVRIRMEMAHEALTRCASTAAESLMCFTSQMGQLPTIASLTLLTPPDEHGYRWDPLAFLALYAMALEEATLDDIGYALLGTILENTSRALGPNARSEDDARRRMLGASPRRRLAYVAVPLCVALLAVHLGGGQATRAALAARDALAACAEVCGYHDLASALRRIFVMGSVDVTADYDAANVSRDLAVGLAAVVSDERVVPTAAVCLQKWAKHGTRARSHAAMELLLHFLLAARDVGRVGNDIAVAHAAASASAAATHRYGAADVLMSALSTKLAGAVLEHGRASPASPGSPDKAESHATVQIAEACGGWGWPLELHVNSSSHSGMHAIRRLGLDTADDSMRQWKQGEWLSRLASSRGSRHELALIAGVLRDGLSIVLDASGAISPSSRPLHLCCM
ncbi:hypothetical protein NFJ02_03g104310 [Pycnococcus provasolii]